MIIYTTKTRFFVATDISDYVQWLQRNYVDTRKEVMKRTKGTTTGCRAVIGNHSTNTKRYNYNLSRLYKR